LTTYVQVFDDKFIAVGDTLVQKILHEARQKENIKRNLQIRRKMLVMDMNISNYIMLSC
jgi:hypothetical protein